jgi:hypothetical protein
MSFGTHVIYCGDSPAETEACYFTGILHDRGIGYGYLPNDGPLPRRVVPESSQLLVLSDLPARQISEKRQLKIVERIEAGAGLLMIGGSRSFRGVGGYWNEMPLGRLLPVEMSGTDDRHLSDTPMAVKPLGRHAITDELPWTESPTFIDGLNHVACKADDEILLSAEKFDVRYVDGEAEVTPVDVFPLLCVGRRGHGRVAAFMSDIGPPWIGSMIDWGPERLIVPARRRKHEPAIPGIDVGSSYAEFFTRLVLWLLQRL